MCPPGVTQSNRVPGSDLVHTRPNLCTSTQSLSAMPPPYYSMFPGLPPAGGTEPLYQMSKQQQYALHQQQQRQYQQQQQQQYNQQQYNHQQQYNQHQELQYQQIHQKELQQKLERQQHQNRQQIQNMAAHNSSLPTESGKINSAQPGVDHVDGVPDPGSGGDMCSMIRRGVKLRRTLTNDRSAPLITPYHLNWFYFSRSLNSSVTLQRLPLPSFRLATFSCLFIVEVCFLFLFLRGGKTVD